MWENLPEEQRSEYKKMILAFASLSEMFAQKENSEDTSNIAPIINSKYQETVFQRAFNASAEDIGNTSYDVALQLACQDGKTIKYLIGIKTFGISSGDQKVAQFKGNQGDWLNNLNNIRKNSVDIYGRPKTKEEIDSVNKDLYLEVAKSIATLRNMRIDSSRSNIIGFSILNENDLIDSVYHVLMPSSKDSKPEISVGETSYDKIVIDNIKIIGCTSAKHPTNFLFTDGKHQYKFTSADSQLLMDFDNTSIVKEKWPVIYADDAYSIFNEIADRIHKYNASPIVESHSWKINVRAYSGFNSFYGVGSKLSKEIRRDRIEKFRNKFEKSIESTALEIICEDLTQFLLSSSETKQQKEILRTKILQKGKSTNNCDLIQELYKLLFRPKNEVYIPIFKSKLFHSHFPDFFGQGIGHTQFGERNKENTLFKLKLEPSGEEIDCFINQDGGKAIESIGKQDILGEWLLRKVFQLDDYMPLTQKRLNQIGINGIRLYKTTDNIVHLEFIWIENKKLPDDYLEHQLKKAL